MKICSQNWVLYFFVLTLSGCSYENPVDTLINTTPSCLMATLTIKELVDLNYQNSTLEPETIMIDGKSFRISTIQKSIYTYDTLRRILTEYNQYEGSQQNYYGIADSIYYQYGPGVVHIRRIEFKNEGKREDSYSYKLDEQGYSAKYFGGESAYDSGGYLISYVDDWGIPAKIINGNVVESVISLEGPLTECFIYRNEYDLEKAGLPSVKTFAGSRVRNLIKGYSVDGKRYLNDPTTRSNLYVATYSYLFDDKSRVKRQIFQGKNNGYLFGGGSSVKTTDFSYVCP